MDYFAGIDGSLETAKVTSVPGCCKLAGKISADPACSHAMIRIQFSSVL